MRLLNLIDELKRRSVIRVGIAYAVAAWLIVQVADIGLDSFAAPDWVMKTLLMTLALGLPIALLLAWAFELTPEGIKRDEQVDRGEQAAHGARRKLDIAIIGLLSVALVYFAATHDWRGSDDQPDGSGPKSIAVLPFDNMTGSQENAYFASGVHEDILTYLAKVADLRVISRSSVQQYATDERNLKVVAAELGVDHIVEGSVRRAGNTVRVTAQLIDARTDEHLWADNYDRDVSNVFEIQTAIAQEIVAALRARLSTDEQRAITRVATRNVAAYEKFSQARAIRRDSAFTLVQIRQMEPLLLEAVALDPNFAVARAMLGSVHTNFYWLDLDRTSERLERAKREIDIAFELQPDLPEARAALAEYYYRGFNNYARAIQELEAAYAKYPNNTDVLKMMGITQRRLGRWDAAIESLRAASQLDPGDMGKKHLLLETMSVGRKWAMASAYGDQLVASHPQEPSIRAERAKIYLSGYGDVEAAKKLFAGGRVELEPDYLYVNLLLRLVENDYDGALALVARYEALINAFPPGARSFLFSWIYNFKGDAAKTRKYAARAAEELQPFLDFSDVNASTWQNLVAESYVHLGQTDEAIRIARQVLETNPLSRDAFEAPSLRATAARVIAMAGDIDAGLSILKELVGKPAGPTVWDLRLDPNWRFLKNDPRFATIANP